MFKKCNINKVNRQMRDQETSAMSKTNRIQRTLPINQKEREKSIEKT